MRGAGDRPLTVEEGRLLHARLLAGSRVAAAELVAAYLNRLARWLARTNPGLDPHQYDTAAEDALLSLIRNPASYNPSRAELESYLRMAATGDLRNLLRREGRHHRRRVPMAAVEVSPELGKHLQDSRADPARVVEMREAAAEARAAMRRAVPDSVRDGLPPGEVRALELWMAGERRTTRFAEALNIAHLPPKEQARAVKRLKDKLKKRVARAGGRL